MRPGFMATVAKWAASPELERLAEKVVTGPWRKRQYRPLAGFVAVFAAAAAKSMFINGVGIKKVYYANAGFLPSPWPRPAKAQTEYTG